MRSRHINIFKPFFILTLLFLVLVSCGRTAHGEVNLDWYTSCNRCFDIEISQYISYFSISNFDRDLKQFEGGYA